MLLCPWDSPGKHTGVGCHSLLQGIYLTQESSLHLLCLQHCRRTLYPSASSDTRFLLYKTLPYFEGPKLQGLVYLPPPYGQKGDLHSPLLGAYNLNLR